MKNPIDYETDEDFYDALKEMHRQEMEDNESIVALVRLLAWVIFIIMGAAAVLLLIF